MILLSLQKQDLQRQQNVSILNFFKVIENPGIRLRRRLAEAINANGHMPYAIDKNSLYHAPYVIVILNDKGEIVAGCSIKSIAKQIAEIGHMIVLKSYQRLGIAQAMTQKRIEFARHAEIELLYAMVRDYNTISKRNLAKAGFTFQKQYLCPVNPESRLDCYTKPLQRLSRQRLILLLEQVLSERIPVIY